MSVAQNKFNFHHNQPVRLTVCNIFKDLNIVVTLLLTLVTTSVLASETNLTILHTNDWQSRLLGFGPNASYSPDSVNDDETVGGISRLATLIEQRRNNLGKDKVLLLDGGDYSMGTLFHTIIRETGSELQLMTSLKYDAITLGNHEFDFRPEGLAQSIESALRIKGSLPPIVISNMIFDEIDPADDRLQALWQKKVIRPYVVLEKSNQKIGIFGLMGADAAVVAPNAAPISFADPIETAKRMVKILLDKEHVDLVIVLSHGGIHADESSELKWVGEDVDLLTQVPGIDIIVGGHSHTPLRVPIIKDGRIILQAGSETQYLGELSLTIDKGQTIKTAYSLHPINDKIMGEATYIKDINYFKQQVTDLFLHSTGYQFDQQIAKTKRQLSRQYDDPVLANLVTDSMKNITHSDIAITTNGPIRDNIYLGTNGIQQVSDLFRIVPLGVGVMNNKPGYDLIKVWITGSEIKNIIEALLLAFETHGDSFYPRFSGFKVVYNSARIPFDQILQIKLGDEENGYFEIDLSSDNAKLYSMATNSFVGSMAWFIEKVSYGLLEFTPKNKQGIAIVNLSEGVFDSDEHQAGIQEIKEWRAFFDHLKTLPDLNHDNLADLPTISEVRLTKITSYNPSNLYQNATGIMYFGTLIIFIGLAFILWFAIKTYRLVIKNKQQQP